MTTQVILDSTHNTTTPMPPPQRLAQGGRARFRPLALLWGSLSPLLLLATFAGLFYFGHHYDWKLPKFSVVAGAPPAEEDDWCEEHGVTESRCVECNPDLMPKGPDYGWCAEHGVHNCPLHHPDVAQLDETPEVLESDLERATRALALRDRASNNAVCTVYQRRIQFESQESVRQAGVDVELVGRQSLVESVEGQGEITYDQTRLANLSSRASGTAYLVLKSTGDTVREGDVLALIDAMEVGRTKSELMKSLLAEELARQTFDRLSGVTSGAISGRQIIDAEAALAQAEADVLMIQQSLANMGLSVDVADLRGLSQDILVDQLRFVGIPEDLTAELTSETTTANLIPIRSPLDGVVVERQVVAGEVVDPTRVLFQVADTSRMWLTLSIPLEEAHLLSLGQTTHFRPAGSSSDVTGQLTWISTSADEHTRMIRARADLLNTDGQLRHETFGAGRVVLREEEKAIAVPNGAIHWEGCCFIVFVRDKDYFDSEESPKVFHVRSVRLGATNGDFTEIIAGVLPGEVVVTTGSDVLRAQLLKNNLGEGCTCVAE